MAESVRIVEVGPRDGLQNEGICVPVAVRVAFIEKLVDAGLTSIEAGSFVSPKWVPQMADTADVLKAVAHRTDIAFPVLVPNEKGLEAALAAGAREVAIFGAASETFSRKNINCSIDESFERFAPVAERALAAGLRVRGYVSCVLGCPYEGHVPRDRVATVAARLLGLGCYEVSLGDTIGVGTPRKAREMLRAVAEQVPVARLAVHFHDTYGQAVANIYACLEEGVRVVDSSAGGLGGCPYAKGASGNVATEDVVYLLDGLGFESGVRRNAVIEASRSIFAALGKTSTSVCSDTVGG
jgi:isopropylmalate/homocitrate/citramalate synthase